MDYKEILYSICLTLTSGIGDIRAKKLIEICGGPEAVFREKRHILAKIPGVGSVAVENISEKSVIKRAEEEMNFIDKFGIMPLFYRNDNYPDRLKNCEDGPVLLFVKGNISLNFPKVIGVVGTRKATSYGRDVCSEIINGLASKELLVVSGLAIGIDGYAHKASLENNIATAAVLAHGLDRIYPPGHRSLAAKILSNGAIVSDFPSQTIPDRENFPKRNRIIAGLSDAVIVVEAGQTGGALITAGIANSYNRDVFAVPGRVNDIYSKGCNRLIRNNKAALIESAEDIKYLMGWADKPKKIIKVQQELFENLTEDEKKLISILEINGECSADFLSVTSCMPVSKTVSALFNLEINGLVKALPGKRFLLN